MSTATDSTQMSTESKTPLPSMSDSAPLSTESKSTQTECDPSTFVPSLPASGHLVFASHTVDSKITRLIEACVLVQSQSPPNEVAKWLSEKLVELTNSITQAALATHRANARLLAERVLHKFRKWGPVRFGSTPSCQRCFYTGNEAVDSKHNAITFDPVFESELRQVAPNEADTILQNLHIGQASAARFRDFISVPSIPSVDTEDDEDDDDEQECGCGGHEDDDDEIVD